MTVKMLQQARKAAYQFLAFQLILTGIISILFAIFASLNAAYSALLGGAVCVIANSVFISRYFAVTDAQAANTIVKLFYRAEISKLLIIIALFALVMKFVNVLPLTFFITYIVVQLSFWLAPWFFAKT